MRPEYPADQALYQLDESGRLLDRARAVDASFLRRGGVIGSSGGQGAVPVFADREIGRANV